MAENIRLDFRKERASGRKSSDAGILNIQAGNDAGILNIQAGNKVDIYDHPNQEDGVGNECFLMNTLITSLPISDSYAQVTNMKIDGKVALITGAASGIGNTIAQTFAREGAKVVIADLSLESAQTAVDQIVGDGGSGLAVAMDVTREEQVEAGIAAAVTAYGRVDVLVSNAGIQHIDPLVQLSFDNWRKVLAVHLDGAFLTTRACLRHMIQAGRGGSIIYMGSVHSKEASPLKAPYVTAKHGLIGLAKVVAKEGAQHGIRANVVCPGFVRTPLVDRQIPEQARELGISEQEVIKNVMLKETVDGEFTTTEDVAAVTLFLAAFPTNALTGQSIVVSHGWFMQ